MKKLALLLIVLMTVGVFAGCAPAEPETQPEPQPSEETQEPAQPTEEAANFDVADGVYYAQEAAFAGSGWKYNVTVTVADGNVVDVNWNGTNVRGGDDKDIFRKRRLRHGSLWKRASGMARASTSGRAVLAGQPNNGSELYG